MRALILFAVLLIPIVSQATFPKEGNYARYEAKLDGDSYEMKKMIFEQDLDGNSFFQIMTIYKNGVKFLEETIRLPFMSFYNPAKVQSTLDGCLRRGGAYYNELIGEHRIPTCTFHNESAQVDYSIGMVPFGQVRHQFYLGLGVYLDFQLIEFSMGYW